MNDRRPSPVPSSLHLSGLSHHSPTWDLWPPHPLHLREGHTLGMSFLTLQGTGCMQFKNPVLGQDKWLNAQASWYTRGLWASPRWPQADTATSLTSWTLSTSPGQEHGMGPREEGKWDPTPLSLLDSSLCSGVFLPHKPLPCSPLSLFHPCPWAWDAHSPPPTPAWP